MLAVLPREHAIVYQVGLTRSRPWPGNHCEPAALPRAGVLRVLNFTQTIIYVVLDELPASYLPAIHVYVAERVP